MSGNKTYHIHLKALSYLALVAGLLLLAAMLELLWEKTKYAQVWELLPKSAIMAIEIQHFPDWIEKTDTLAIKKSLEDVEVIEDLFHFGKRLTNWMNQDSLLWAAATTKPLLISLHPLARETQSWLFFLPMPHHTKENDAFLKAHPILFPENSFSAETRNYLGFTIYEYFNADHSQAIAYLLFKDYLIASTSSFLLDEVARQISKEKHPALATYPHPFLRRQPLTPNARILIKTSELSKIDQRSLTDYMGPLKKYLEDLPNSLMFNISLEEASLQFNTTQPAPLFSDFQKKHYLQSQLIPARLQGKTYWWVQSPVLHQWQETTFGRPLAELQKQLSNSFFLGQMDENSLLATWKVIDSAKVQTWLSSLSPVEDINLAKAPRQLRIGGHPVWYLPDASLAEKLLPGYFPPKKGFYLSLWNAHLILSDHAYAISEVFQTQAPNSQTTDLSPSLARFQVNLLSSWPKLMTISPPSWKKALEYHRNIALRFEHLEFSLVPDSGTNPSWQIALVHRQKAREDSLSQKDFQLNFQAPLKSNPNPLVNHYSKATEILVQDQTNKIHLVGANGQTLWSLPAWHSLSPQVYQMDQYNNQKLQILFAAGSQVHLLDRLGRSLRWFPVEIPSLMKINNLFLFDPFEESQYQILAADAIGNAYMMDQKGKLMAGWGPRRLNNPLVHAEYLETEGTGFHLLLSQNGTLNVLDRQANSKMGFPVRLQKPVNPKLITKQGEQGEITMLTYDGELVSVDLAGKMLAREELPRTVPGAKFILCPNEAKQNTDGWIAARIDPYLPNSTVQISFFNAELDELFTKRQFGSSQPYIQYFYFNPQVTLIAITEPSLEVSRIFYDNGNALLQHLPSDKPLVLMYEPTQRLLVIYHIKRETLHKTVLSIN